MEKQVNFEEAYLEIDELLNDPGSSKNVKKSCREIKKTLSDKSKKPAVKVDKALQELERLCEDVNVDSFTRMRLYNISGVLESLLRN